MHYLDLLVIGFYLAGVLYIGSRFSRNQTGIHDYFLTGQRVPWWALLGSIVATETSTITLISIPGYAFGSNLTFLQLALGYIVGRTLVALFLIPLFFRGTLLTAYQLLTKKFGSVVGRTAAGLFLLTRSVSDGLRLFATGLVLALMLSSMPEIDALPSLFLSRNDNLTELLILSIFLIAVATLSYTLVGGMQAVIWTDVIQLTVYLAGAFIAGTILLGQIPGGWGEIIDRAAASGKLELFDFSLDWSKNYTFWSSLIGGIFIAASTHGADQLFVQRYLCARSQSDARRALIASGVIILLQFGFFLILGIMLWVYYTNYEPTFLARLATEGQIQTDRVFPHFIATHLPIGLRGLLIAAIVAAGMSTLSSSLNSSAASTVGDFYLPFTNERGSPQHHLRVSKWITVGWALVQFLVALTAIGLSRSVVDEALGIQSLTGGLLLGVFALSFLRTQVPSRALILGLAVGAATLFFTRILTDISWQWYALIGCLTTSTAALSVTSILSAFGSSRRLT